VNLVTQEANVVIKYWEDAHAMKAILINQWLSAIIVISNVLLVLDLMMVNAKIAHLLGI
jgi:hypothetical protein